MKRVNQSVRISNLALVFALFSFSIIIYRLVFLSLSSNVDGINLQTFASSRTTKKTITKASRGSILDKNGNILAQDISTYTLIAYLDSNRTIDKDKPSHVVDKENTALIISGILEMDYEAVLKYLYKENVYQTEFGTKGKNLNEIMKDRILALNLPGIDFIETKTRYYPYGNFASYLIGYAKKTEDNSIVGELGIEKYYNDSLTGLDGYTIYQKDRNGYKIAGTEEISAAENDGKDIYLTLDNNVQLFLEHAINTYSNQYTYDELSIVVANAKTGAILGYTTDPGFDPNTRDLTNYMDANASVSFEPGSTMKIYTYMAALESGVYNGNAKYKSGNFKTTDGTIINDWKKAGWGVISYDQGFIYSSNTAVVNLMKNYLDASILKDYLLRLGFGSKTGLTIANEASGKIDFKYETEIYNAAFGQGILTTSIQHIKALTSIANNGMLLEPYIVSKIVDNNKVILENNRNELYEVASQDTIDYLKDLMWHTVNDLDGAAKSYRLDGYNIIGKTGTAQIATTNGKGYLTGSRDVVRSIALMFPKDDPEIIIYGKVTRSSSVNPLSTAVKDIVKNIAKYYNIYQKKENTLGDNTYPIPNFMNKKLDDVSKVLKSNGITPIVIGDGDIVINQYPNDKTIINMKDKVFLVTNSNNIKMPKINGYSKNEVITLANLLDISYEVEGNGYVYEQSIKEGVTVNHDSCLAVKLKLLYTS